MSVAHLFLQLMNINGGIYDNGRSLPTMYRDRILCISQFQRCPSPPPGNRGAFAHVVSPGGGAFAILSRPRGWALAYPGATPGHLTQVSKLRRLRRKTYEDK